MMEKMDAHGLIREGDEKNFHIAGKDLKVPIEIQDLYWQMDDVRQKLTDESNIDEKKKFLQKVSDLGSVINSAKGSADEDARYFLGMVNDELTKMSLKLQLAIRKEEKLKNEK